MLSSFVNLSAPSDMQLLLQYLKSMQWYEYTFLSNIGQALSLNVVYTLMVFRAESSLAVD